MKIQYFTEGSDFQLPNQRKTSSWIRSTVRKEKGKISDLSIIFCTDKYLLKLNSKYLHHHTLTDILTFDYSEKEGETPGEIYISLERVEENAEKYKKTFDNELHRVIIHGVLHLLGYKDKTARNRSEMRKKEEAYLSLR